MSTSNEAKKLLALLTKLTKQATAKGCLLLMLKAV